MRAAVSGFSIIELAVAMTVIAILMVLGMPSFSGYLQNARLGASAKSYFSGLSLARSEAIRRNAPVEFVMTNTTIGPGVENSVTPSSTGQSWVVRARPSASAPYELVEAKSLAEGGSMGGTSSVNANSVAGAAPIVFGSLGNAISGPAIISLSNPTMGLCVPSGPVRCFDVRVELGGQVRLCTPDPPPRPATPGPADTMAHPMSRPSRKTAHAQRGVFLIEALIAILIFSLGILGLVAMGGVAIAAQGDAQYRTDAANYANEMAAEIALGMNNNASQNATILGNFGHHPVPGGGPCAFAGSPSPDPRVTAWVNRITGVTDPRKALPGADASSQQIQVNTSAGAYNKVTITICWRPPTTQSMAGAPWHSHTLVTYINPNDA